MGIIDEIDRDLSLDEITTQVVRLRRRLQFYYMVVVMLGINAGMDAYRGDYRTACEVVMCVIGGAIWVYVLSRLKFKGRNEP